MNKETPTDKTTNSVKGGFTDTAGQRIQSDQKTDEED